MSEQLRYPALTRRPLDLSQTVGGRELTFQHRWVRGGVRDSGDGYVLITMVSSVAAVLAGPRKLVISEDLFGAWRPLLLNPEDMLPGRFRCYRVDGDPGDPSMLELGTGACVVEYVED